KNPHSSFGVTEVVLHDQPAPPKPNRAHLRAFLSGPPPTNAAEFARRYAERLASALQAWKIDRATDDDARWLDAFLGSGGLSNRKGIHTHRDKLLAEYRDLDANLTRPRIVPGL